MGTGERWGQGNERRGVKERREGMERRKEGREGKEKGKGKGISPPLLFLKLGAYAVHLLCTTQ